MFNLWKQIYNSLISSTFIDQYTNIDRLKIYELS